MIENLKLPPEALTLIIKPEDIGFDNLPDLGKNILGQPRAQSALEFGIAMTQPGYNIFVMGEPGLGRLAMITQRVCDLASKQPCPQTLAYINNFTNTGEPLSVQLPAGFGNEFCSDIEKLIDNLLATFPAIFENPGYQQKKSVLERKFQQTYNDAIASVERHARLKNIALFRDNETISFSPIKNNKPLDEEQFAVLSQSERDTFHEQVEELEEYLSNALLDLPQWRRTMLEHIKRLDNDTIREGIAPLFAELYAKYNTIKDASSYLSAIDHDLSNTMCDYLTTVIATEANVLTKRSILVDRYLPNILVDYQAGAGAPVVYEPHPTYHNLFGRIEYRNDQGALIAHYQNIRAGSLHKANGGYLIIDAEKLLSYPFVWDALKRALQLKRIEIESPFSDIGVTAVTLKPQIIPLSLKIILLGAPDIYYLLEEIDSEFNENFKILADFDYTIRLTERTQKEFTARLIQHANMLGNSLLTPMAVYKLIEHSCRQAENQQQLSAHIKDSLDLVSEAGQISHLANSVTIDIDHVEQALLAREYRNGRLSQTVLDDILDGTILIATDGEAIGKINGLTIIEISGSSFGAPARITATVYPGTRGIVDIEKEAELGQSIHSKGVMILTGYLGHCYAQRFPLAISASIAIEQSYGYIDGDSASLAELCCLISALTCIPIKQSFAVTGSINQYGEVQAVGGINEKIEGFFRLCQARGLTNRHAVIIPAANKRNLMLQQDVIDAVTNGLFSIYAVATVEETLELLTGKPAGTADKEGNFPEDCINFRAISRLKEISDMSADENREESGNC